MKETKKETNDNNIEKYITYIDENVEQLAVFVNELFEKRKDEIRQKLIDIITGYLDPIPTHYEWYYDGCPYDFSGDIKEAGEVSLDQTVIEFLENEYTGGKTPTFTSGRGWNYDTYSDSLRYDTMDMGYDIMLKTVQRELEKHFGVSLTDKDMNDITFARDFDDIYDECLASEFFFPEFVVEYVGINDIKLSDLVKK